MPAWTESDEDQYEAIRDSELKRGKPQDAAKELASRIVNKRRRKEGRTPSKTTQGTGNPHRRLENRSVDELRNIVRQLKVEGRSKLTRKDALVAAIRSFRNSHKSKKMVDE